MSSLGRIAGRSAKRSRRQYFESCGSAVRKLAVQARLWKMAPDEMDTRYESLLRRCAATERRFQTTTVSDILARISETLKSNETQRHITSPDLIPCDLAKDAHEDALISLEEDATINASQHVDDDSYLYLDEAQPAVITIISPSSTSLSSSTEELSFSKHKPKKARTEYTQSASQTKRPQPHRMRRRISAGSTACYPRMSWKRAHEVVQSRKRCSKRRRSPYTNRPPLETNPGWTPLQKAILKSGILRSPAPLPFICPDSPQNLIQTNRRVENHQNSEHLSRNQEQISANVDICDYTIEHKSTASELATPIYTERIPACIDHNSPENNKREAPRTPEVIIRRRRLSLTESRSESVFSDSSRVGCRSDEDEYLDEIPSSGSLDDADEDWSPTGTSTPICSAMKLLLHAEPFVPSLNRIENKTTSDAQWSLKPYKTPFKMTVQQTTMENSLKTDSDVRRNIDPANSWEDTIQDTNYVNKSEIQSQIPVIIHGMTKDQPRSSNGKQENVIDVKPTQSWIAWGCDNKTQSQVQVNSKQMNSHMQGGFSFSQSKVPGNTQKQPPLIHHTPTMPFAGLVLVPHQVPVQQIRPLQQTQVQQFSLQHQSGRPVQQQQQHVFQIQQQWHPQQQQSSNLTPAGMNQQRQLQQQQVWNTQHIQMTQPKQHVQQQRTQYQPFQRQVSNLQQQQHQQQMMQQQHHAAYRQQQNQQQVFNGPGNGVLPLDTSGAGRVPFGNFPNQHQQHAGFNNNNFHQRPHVPPPQNYQLQQPIRPRFPNNCGVPPMANRSLLNTPPIRSSTNMFQPPFQSAWQGRC